MKRRVWLMGAVLLQIVGCVIMGDAPALKPGQTYNGWELLAALLQSCGALILVVLIPVQLISWYTGRARRLPQDAD